MSAQDVKTLAEDLAAVLTADVEKCITREEHVRVSARANAAVQLLMSINQILDETTSSVATES